MIRKHYRNSAISARTLGEIRNYINSENSLSLGIQWGHKVVQYTVRYSPTEEVVCESWNDLIEILGKRGDSTQHAVYFESRTGRKLRIDAMEPTRITVEAENRFLTLDFIKRVEDILGLEPLPPKVFISHGRSPLWLEVQRFIEKDAPLNLETMELAEEASKGRTLSQKLREEADQCSYAVIVMTGDDTADDGGAMVRENVMHEIGFFQGRYGFDRVCLLHEDGVSIPTNLSGSVYIPFPVGKIRDTFIDLQKELLQAFP